MTNFDFIRFFGNFNNNDSNSSSKKRANKQRRGRQCRIEQLEEREMLNAAPLSAVLADISPNTRHINRRALSSIRSMARAGG